MSRYLQRSVIRAGRGEIENCIRREENARFFRCVNRDCKAYGEKWRVNEDDEPAACDACHEEGRESR